MASMVADEMGVRGLACLGYPFHPPGRVVNGADSARVAHLRELRTPTLVLQGTRDSFGSREQVRRYALSPAIRVHWLDDGDHGFKPRKTSGRTEQHNWNEGIDILAGFLDELTKRKMP